MLATVVAGATTVVASSARAIEVPEPVLAAQQQRIETIAKAARTTLAVFGKSADQGGGSGVVISPDGFALTNFHVASPSGHHMRCGMADGRLYDAVIVGIDPTGDVALIKLFGPDDEPDFRFPYSPLGDSDKIRVGDWSFAAGNPFLLANDYQPSISYGMISGVHRYQYPAGTLLEYADCLQFDTAINPGNSGGPLFNAGGEVIGIVGRGSFEKRGRVNVGVGYAVSINQIKNFLGYLHSGRVVDHATLGATVGTDSDGNVVVTNILESSDAYRRGLRYDDEIVEFAGRPMRTVNAFKNALGIFPKGWRVPLTYRRDGVTHDVVVRLAGVHRSRELWALASRTPPKPDEKPGDDKPDKKDPNDAPPDDEEPEKKPRLPKLPELPEFPFDLKKKPKDPQVITDHYEVRPGFANYYYNRRHLDRVWKGFAGHGDFSALLGNWTLGGQSLQGGDVQFQIDEQRGVAILPAGQSTVDFTSQFGRDLKPLGSGGLLTALACWRRMLLVGPQRYGKVEYVGTAPLAGSMLTVDVVSATNEGVESHFLFDPDEGQLVGLEMFPASDVDPCEIYFADYREVDGRRLPHELEVRHGDLVFGRYKLNYFDLAEKGQP